MTISLKGCLSGMEIKSTNSKRPGCTHCQLHFNTRHANCMLCLLSGCIIKANLYWLDEFMLKLTINSCFVLYLYKKACIFNYQSPLIITALFQHNLINVSYLTACYLYQVMMTLHFLNDVDYDAESTQTSKNTS